MMVKKSASLLFALIGLLLMTIPAGKASAQLQSNDAVRVISLSDLGHDRANAVIFTPNGHQLIVAASAGIYLFDSQTLFQDHFIPTGTWVRSLAISPDGHTLAAGLFDNTARLWRLSDLLPVHTYVHNDGWVRNIAFTPNGRWLATVSDDDMIRLWDRENTTLQLVIKELKGARTLAISPDGAMLAVGLQNGAIQLYSLPDGEFLLTLTGHKDWVRCLTFSPDGQKLASGAFDATARLWNIASGELEHIFSGHQSSVLGLAFSPDGTTLATGSVDKTVRLWTINDGSMDRVLAGHDGFVYSVAFSPDGQTLASGSEDNTIRLWDLNILDNHMADPPATPGDCRVCHHPMNSASPPAVVEVRCDACHPSGIGLNWCPYFPPSPGDSLLLPVSMQMAGLPVPAQLLDVSIFSPSNGETLYSHYDYVAPVTVSGRVLGINDPLAELDVRLEIWSGSTMLSSLHNNPDSNGFFDFLLGVNPEGHMLFINDPAAPLTCSACHDDFNVQAYLPSGDLRLLVVATTKDGTEASDERWIRVDISRTRRLNIEIEEGASRKPLHGLTIQAFTRLYEWRGRIASTASNEAGGAVLELEILSQAITNYEIMVPDQVVDGIFYSSPETKTVLLDPDATTIPQVTFNVFGQKGQINGRLTSDDDHLPQSVKIWAFGLPAGPDFYTETARDGTFSFTNLPVSVYSVVPDPGIMRSDHLMGSQQIIDLTQSPISDVALELHSVDGLVWNGEVSGQDGEWLPFAWLTTPDGLTHQVEPESGKWIINTMPVIEQAWVTNAPGYFSQEIELPSEGLAPAPSIMLERRPDVALVAWGDGEIVIPSETQANAAKDRIKFESGWIWGYNHAAQPFVLETLDAEIRLSDGYFALERPPGGIARFYLFEDGKAEVRSKKTGEILVLQSGNMVVFMKDGHLSELPYVPAKILALGTEDELPLSPVWKPGVSKQILITLSKISISTAQMVTFITYIIAVSSLGIVPWFLLKWWLKRGKANGEEK
ncbi:MAG: hypothetical protein QY332_05455 [Anaerolineales bacterium]|nr:MAG: hypothetical protein QY332_05455 [Anaerolineales bacterium]